MLWGLRPQAWPGRAGGARTVGDTLAPAGLRTCTFNLQMRVRLYIWECASCMPRIPTTQDCRAGTGTVLFYGCESSLSWLCGADTPGMCSRLLVELDHLVAHLVLLLVVL